MRILHVIASVDPRGGGPVEGALRIGEIWRRQGHVQDLVTFDPPDAPFLKDVDATVYATGGGGRLRRFIRYGFAPGLVAWLRANAADYDAVIVAGLWNFSILAARLTLPRGRVPYFVYTHGMLDPWFREQYPLKHFGKKISWLVNEGRLLRHARAVLFTTEEERRLAENAFRPYHVNARVVGYGTSDVTGDPAAQLAAFKVSVPQVAGRPFLLFLSRIHPKKGCDLLIEAFAGIAAAVPDWQLVIAGPDQIGLVAELQAQALRLGIADRVHFPGMITGDAKWGAFRACEAMALTSHQENFGVVVAEAMACAKPVLISDKVNIWHEVVADDAGLVEPDTVAGALELLKRFVGMTPDARAAMGQRARTSFTSRFTAQAAADALMAVIEAETRGRRDQPRAR